MLTLLSPAKKLLKDFKTYTHHTSQPVLIKKAIELAYLMKSKSIEEISTLMTLSKDLAVLNFERYQQFSFDLNPPATQSYPALFLFQGDVYQGLQATSWDKAAVEYSQDHLAILSGLYGVLKPLDLIQPYRLEMGVRLNNPCGNNLYDFWKNSITHELNQQLKQHANPLLINLASTEYFKSVDVKILEYPAITINFYEQKNNEIKMVGIHAKKARGCMAKFIMQNHIDTLEQIKTFKEMGYYFNKDSSTATHIDFVRVHD